MKITSHDLPFAWVWQKTSSDVCVVLPSRERKRNKQQSICLEDRAKVASPVRVARQEDLARE